MGKIKRDKVPQTTSRDNPGVQMEALGEVNEGLNVLPVENQKQKKDVELLGKKVIKKKKQAGTRPQPKQPQNEGGDSGNPKEKEKPKITKVKKIVRPKSASASVSIKTSGGDASKKDKTTAIAVNKDKSSETVPSGDKSIKKSTAKESPSEKSNELLAKMTSQFSEAVTAAKLAKSPQKKRVIKYAHPGEKPTARPSMSIVVSTSAPVLLESRTTGPSVKEVTTKKKIVTIKKVKKKIVKQEKESDISISDLAHSILQNSAVEDFSIHHLYQEMRESCVISDRWCIPEPMWDPYTNHEVLLCYEVDVLMDGSVRMKRCIKILDNFELIVLLDGSDKTHLFKEKHPTIRSSQELLDLIRKVTMVKVCSGIIHCDPSDFDSLSVKVIARGGSWYSSECNVEVERGCLGNICKKCTSLRNTIRRKLRRQVGVDNPSNNQNPSSSRSLLSNSLKPVARSLGEALYSNLHHMSGANRFDEDEMRLLPPPRSSEQVFHPELKIYMNSDLKERLDEVAADPTPPMTETQIVEIDPITLTKTIKRIHTPIMPTFRTSLTGGRGSKRVKTSDASQNQSFVMGNNGELTLVQGGEALQLQEGFVFAEESNAWGENVVVQKLDPAQESQIIIGEDNSIVVGSNFTLQDGEEYEVIGEAASGEGDSIQVLPLNTNSDIEIIEVDENMIQLVDENSQPEIVPIDSNSDIFKFLQAHSRLQA